MSRFEKMLAPKQVTLASVGTEGSEWFEGHFTDGWLQPSVKLHIYAAVRIEFDLFLLKNEVQENATRNVSVYINERFIKDFVVSRDKLGYRLRQ
jgi:hypothetical protein